jgi:methionyl aminopeptidase
MQKYSEDEIKILKEGGKRLYDILNFLGEKCLPGVTGKEIDSMAEKMILENGDIPVFKNYKPYGAAYPYPATICISVNDCVAHGIPTEDIVFKEGDVVSLDLGFRHGGLVVDSAITVLVGLSEARKSEAFSRQYDLELKLLECTKKALNVGIETCKPGNRVKWQKVLQYDQA